MITETSTGKGVEYNYPQYSTIVSADGRLTNDRRRNFVGMLFGIDGDTAEILLLSHNNKPIDNAHEASNFVRDKVVSFIKDNYDIENVRFE